MRELDVLLLRYLDKCYEQADDREKAAFQALLHLSDPELNAYLLQREMPEQESIALVIGRILSFSQT